MKRLLIFLPFNKVLLPVYILLGLFMVIISIAYFREALTYAGYPHSIAYIIATLASFASLSTSPINLVLKTIPRKYITQSFEVFYFFGIPIYLPKLKIVEDKIIIAINFGGAIIPLVVTILLLLTFDLTNLTKLLLLTILGVIISFTTSRVIPGLGVVANPFVTPFVVSLLSIPLFLADIKLIPITSYISSVLGSIIGADILNLRRILNTQPQIVSIGGMGTFDGIYISGLGGIFLGELFIYLLTNFRI
jgi:uncharacterized membrane protein